MSAPRVRAPGKAMLFGEYAVLDGAWGLVAAVDRHATAWLEDRPAGSPFVVEATAAAHAYLRERGRPLPAGTPQVDSSPLYVDGGARKLGVGSSAAVTVAAFASVLRAAGESLDDKQAIFRACDRAHAVAQGVRGSGLDVAASVYGGVLRARRGDHGLVIEPVRWPAAVSLLFVDDSAAAETGAGIARWHGLKADFKATMAELADGTTPEQILAALPAWNRQLEALTAAMGWPVLTDSVRRLDALVAEHGGGAKPSGAGGGDLAVCFVPTENLARLRARLLAEGFRPLDLTVAGDGLHAVQDRTLEIAS